MGYLSLFRVVFNYYIFADCAFFGLLAFIPFQLIKYIESGII